MSRVHSVLVLILALAGCDAGSHDGSSSAALAPIHAFVVCWSNGDCTAGQYCQTAAGGCGAQGTCAAIPRIACIPGGAQVCGCDGATYANDCFALQAGTGVASPGPCRPPISVGGCTTDLDCGVTIPGATQCPMCGADGQCTTQPCQPPIQVGGCATDLDCGLSFPGQCWACFDGQCSSFSC